MNSGNILITGVGGDIGQGLIKCLKETGGGYRLFGCDIDPFAAGRQFIDLFYEAPRATDAGKYHAFIKKLIDERDISCIVPATEFEVEFFSKHKEDFGKDVRILINEPDIINTFFDKYETVKFLKKNNLPYPGTMLVKDCDEKFNFPGVLKPRKGYGRRGMVVINSFRELGFFRENGGDLIIQDLIGTDEEEYTVTVFSTGEDTYSIAFKRSLGYGSLTKIARLVHDDDIHVMAERIAKACGLKGSLNIQCRKTKAGYIPFEINPRFSSTVYARHYFGFQDVKWWMDMNEGKAVRYVPRYKEGVMVRTIGEVFFDLQS